MKILEIFLVLLVSTKVGWAGSEFRFPCIEFANQQLKKYEMGTYDKPKAEVSKLVDNDHVLFETPGTIIGFGVFKDDVVAKINLKNPISGEPIELRYRLKDTGSTCEVISIAGQPWVPFSLNNEICSFVKATKTPEKLKKNQLKAILIDSGLHLLG